MTNTAKKSSNRKITADWSRLFPEFTAWKPLRLLRRFGPVLQGITLDKNRAGTAYTPVAHFHELTMDFPTVSLSVPFSPRSATGALEYVDTTVHGDVHEAVGRLLEEQYDLPLHGQLTLSQVVQAYRDFAAAQQRNRLPIAEGELEGSIFVPAAAGNPGLAEESLELAREISTGWSRSEAPRGWTNTAEWLDWLSRTMQEREALRAAVDEQIAKHGLEELPSYPWATE